MDFKYPHWYQDGNMEPCCDDYMVNNGYFEELPYKMFEFHRESLKDRILCLLGCEVLFSVDARLCNRRLQTT